jgi:hypothetical protein
VLVVATSLIGLIAIITAWILARKTEDLATQAWWVNLAVAGVVVSSAGLGMWILSGRRAVGERRASLVALERPAAELPTRPGSPPARRGETAVISAVRVPGTSLVHDSGCPLVAGKEVEPAVLGSGEMCGVCRP